MPKEDEYAGQAVKGLQYSPDTYSRLEWKCRGTSDEETRKNMREWMKRHGFATGEYVGHLSGKPGDATSPKTDKFIKAVAKRMREDETVRKAEKKKGRRQR